MNERARPRYTMYETTRVIPLLSPIPPSLIPLSPCFYPLAHPWSSTSIRTLFCRMGDPRQRRNQSPSPTANPPVAGDTRAQPSSGRSSLQSPTDPHNIPGASPPSAQRSVSLGKGATVSARVAHGRHRQARVESAGRREAFGEVFVNASNGSHDRE